MSVDPRAAASWGEDASSYERVRPGWPDAALDWLDPRGTVLDLAAGTGKLTRALVGRAARVIAVEPLTGMRAQLAGVGADVRDGHAEALPLQDSSVDAVYVAEAFHWFASLATMAELRRVLRPGGTVGLLWNLERWDGQPWAGVLRSLPRAARPHPTPRATWDVLAGDAAFTPPETARFPHEHVLDAAGFADLVGTWSRVASLPAQERAAILGRVRDVAPDRVRLAYDALAVRARLATV